MLVDGNEQTVTLSDDLTDVDAAVAAINHGLTGALAMGSGVIFMPPVYFVWRITNQIHRSA